VNISEIFLSIQGEGALAGVVSAFVRLAGCDLHCQWCDTAYAWDRQAGRPMTVEQIAAELARYRCPHVVVTGGEPLIWQETPNLLQELALAGKHITVETSATQYRPLHCDLVSISPKLAHAIGTQEDTSSAAAAEAPQKTERLNIPAIQSFIDSSNDYQLKFVVREQGDLEEVNGVVAQLERVERLKVFLMPEARTREQYHRRAPVAAAMCVETGFRFSPRLQVELWGGKKGK